MKKHYQHVHSSENQDKQKTASEQFSKVSAATMGPFDQVATEVQIAYKNK